MASGDTMLVRMRASSAGWADGDFYRVLDYHGYQLVRHARHGAIFRHPVLDSHPDPKVRQIMIPKGRELPGYVTGKVLASVDALLRVQSEQEEPQE